MKKQITISSLTPGIVLAAVLGGALAMPTAASAGEVVREKTVKIIKTTERRDTRRDGVDNWYVDRHREARRQARYEQPQQRGKGHKYGHHKNREVYREVHVYKPVEQRRVYDRRDRYESHDHRDNNGIRISIGYDFVL